MSKKRGREQPNAQSQHVEVFEDLAHENVEIRLKAAKRLLSSVSADKDPSKADVEVIVKRLIKGLCSGRKAARFGYAIALTELLVQLWGADTSLGEKLELSIPDILTLVEEQTAVGANAPNAEVKDYCLGRLFGEEAIIKSAVLFQGRVDDTQWERVLDVVFSLAKKKSYLREPCGWTLYQALDVIKEQAKAKGFVRALVKRLPDDGFAETPEGVAIWLKTLQLGVEVKMPKAIWHKKNPLHPKELTRLASILRESSLSTSEPGKDQKLPKKRGTWSPSLHFAWDEIVTRLLKRDRDLTQQEVKVTTFEKFWTGAIDGSLFTMSSSDERKYSGYLLFQQYVKTVPQEDILALFGDNFLRCLTNHFSLSKHVLNPMAQKTVTILTSRVETEPTSVPNVMEGLLRAVHHPNFDSFLRTKQIAKLIAASETSGLRTLLRRFERIILDPHTEDEGMAAARRESIAQAMVAMLRSRSIQKNWQLNEDSPEFTILVMFFVHASFSSRFTLDGDEVTPNPPISEKSRKALSAKLASCLTVVLTQSQDVSNFLADFFATIRRLETEVRSAKIERMCSDISSRKILEAQESWNAARSKANLDGDDSGITKTLDLLVPLTIIQAYGDDEEAVNLLGDLIECAKPCGNGKDKASSQPMIEALLTLISKPSKLARQLVTLVFSIYTSSVTEAGLTALLQVLETEETVNGHSELFEGDDELLGNGVIHDAGSDVEMVDADEPTSPAALSKGSSSNPNSDEDEDGEADEEELAAFDTKLAQALRTHPGEADLNASESDSSDGEEMDDEQMEALDATLEKVFRERAKVARKKHPAKEAKENVVLFKSRVLDMLAIYVKNEYRNGVCLGIIVPVLRSIRKTRTKQVSEALRDLLNDYNKRYRPKDRLHNFDAVADFHTLWTLLKTIHSEAVHGDGSNLHQAACSHASILLSKIIIANGGAQKDSVVKGIVDIYAQTQRSFLENEQSTVRPKFFVDWVNWMGSIRGTTTRSGAAEIGDDDAV